MTNLIVASIYAFFVVSSGIVILLTQQKRKQNKLDKSVILIAVMLICWLVIEIFYYLSSDPAVVRILFDIKLPFVAAVVVSWFLYTVRFYGMESYFPRAIRLALFVIPLFTLGLAVTTSMHDYIRESLIIVQTQPIHEYIMTRGIWFWVHSIYCYALGATAYLIIIFQHRKLPKGNRLPSWLLFVGYTVIIAGNIWVIVDESNLDISLVAANITLVVVYYATKNYQGLDFLLQARNEAFQRIDKAIFVLDNTDGIVTMNETARRWLTKIGIDYRKNTFQEVIDEMLTRSSTKEFVEDDEKGIDYYFDSGQIYHLKQKPIYDSDMGIIGRLMTVSDETDNRKYIDYLDKNSGMDALTGLANRRQMDADLAELDTVEAYPVAVLFADLNNFKQANDTYGHQQGDILLRVVAEAFKNVCPPNARIARPSGDEFVAIVPNCTEVQLATLILELRSFLKEQSKHYPYDFSIALGYAIKDSEFQTMDEIVALADTRMYADKEAYRQRNS